MKAAQLAEKRNKMQAHASELRNMLDSESADTLNGTGVDDEYNQGVVETHAAFKKCFCITQSTVFEVVDDVKTLKKFIGKHQAADEETIECAKTNKIPTALYNFFRFLSARNTQLKRKREFLAGIYRPDREWRQIFRDELRSRITAYRKRQGDAFSTSAPSDIVQPRPKEKAGSIARRKADMTPEERTAFNTQLRQGKRQRQADRKSSN